MMFCCDKARFLHRLTYAVAALDICICLGMANQYFQFIFNHSDFDTDIFTDEFYNQSTETN